MKKRTIFLLISMQLCCQSCKTRLPLSIGSVYKGTPIGAKNVVSSLSMRYFFMEYDNMNYIIEKEYSSEEQKTYISGIFSCSIKTFHDDNEYLNREKYNKISVYLLVENIGLPKSVNDQYSGLPPELTFVSEEGNEYNYFYYGEYLS